MRQTFSSTQIYCTHICREYVEFKSVTKRTARIPAHEKCAVITNKPHVSKRQLARCKLQQYILNCKFLNYYCTNCCTVLSQLLSVGIADLTVYCLPLQCTRVLVYDTRYACQVFSTDNSTVQYIQYRQTVYLIPTCSHIFCVFVTALTRIHVGGYGDDNKLKRYDKVCVYNSPTIEIHASFLIVYKYRKVRGISHLAEVHKVKGSEMKPRRAAWYM